MRKRRPAVIINETIRSYIIVFIVSLINLTGCTSITKHIDKPLGSSPTELAKAQIHYYKILDELGPPAYISSLSDGFAFQYETLQIDELQFGLSADIDFFRWFKLAYGNAEVERDVHVFIFNKEGYVQAYGNKQIKDDAGKGISYQFIVKVAQVVDTKYLEQPFAQHNWGFSLLKPLPVGMNREQSLDSGAHGLEQRGTPTAVGQRTLELQTVR